MRACVRACVRVKCTAVSKYVQERTRESSIQFNDYCKSKKVCYDGRFPQTIFKLINVTLFISKKFFYGHSVFRVLCEQNVKTFYRPCKPSVAIFCDSDDTFAVVCVQDKTSDSAEQAGFLWEKVTELSSAGIVKIVDFAKKIPGFLTLSTSDQITLLKAACLEIMVSMF